MGVDKFKLTWLLILILQLSACGPVEGSVNTPVDPTLTAPGITATLPNLLETRLPKGKVTEATHPALSAGEQDTATTDLDGRDLIQPVYADVLSVQIAGETGSYQFRVEIRSPDTGCDQYADWWEVIDTRGELIYRRILLHSHPDEQPFIRSGGSVQIQPDTVVWVRAHMNRGGYGGQALRGSVTNGFVITDYPEGFADGLESLPPLPDGCAF